MQRGKLRSRKNRAKMQRGNYGLGRGAPACGLCSRQNPTSVRAGYCVPGRTHRAQGVLLTAQNARLTGSPLSKAHARQKNLQIILQTVQTGYKLGYKPALKPVQTAQTVENGKAYLSLNPQINGLYSLYRF